MRLRIIVILALISACSTSAPRVNRPPFAVVRQGVVIWSENVDKADSMVGMYCDLGERVRSLLKVESAPLPELWLVEEESLGGVIAAVTDSERNLIVLTKTRHDSERTIAHELTHWSLARWPARLPMIVDEGLAQVVAGVVTGALPEIRNESSQTLAQTDVLKIAETLQIPQEVCYRPYDPHWVAHLTSVGFALADAIGIERLERMCTRASNFGLRQVPSEWFEPLWAEIPKPMRLDAQCACNGRVVL